MLEVFFTVLAAALSIAQENADHVINSGVKAIG
jgi:hypothetical protein